MRLTIRNSDGSVSQPTDTTFEAAMNRLAEYEDAEEQGRLTILPCKVGDTVWCLEKDGGKPITMYSDVIQTIGISRDNIKVQTREHKSFGRFLILDKSAFLTPEHAEAAQNEVKVFYEPKYCPECGRKLIENARNKE